VFLYAFISFHHEQKPLLRLICVADLVIALGLE